MPDPTRPASIRPVSTGPELLDHRRADQPADEVARAELIERDAGIEREHGAGEEPGQQDDGQRADADRFELLDDVVAVERPGDHAAERGAAEAHVLLHLEDRRLQPVCNEAQHAGYLPAAERTSRPPRPSSRVLSARTRSRSAAARSKSRLAAAAFMSFSSSAMCASSSACVRNVGRVVLHDRNRRVVALVDARQHVVDRLDDAGRRDAVLLVVGLLPGPAALGLADRGAHRVGHDVGIHDDPAVDVARGAARRLNERAGRAQEPFLVGVENRDQRHFGQVEPLAQQVDADQHVEHAAPQVAQDLDALERVDVRVQVADLDAELLVVRRQVLGHPLGQRRDQHALARARRARGSRCSRSSTCPLTGRTSIGGSIRPVGPDHLLDDDARRPCAARRARASPRRRRAAARALPTPRS